MTTAMKNDKADRKSAMQFIHPDFMEGTGNAMGAGEIKYDGWNFLKGHGRLQLCAAILRHTFAIMRGEDVDANTTAIFGKTVYHWDCIGANINMMIWQREYGTLIEDRPPKSHEEERASTIIDWAVLNKYNTKETLDHGVPIESKTTDTRIKRTDPR